MPPDSCDDKINRENEDDEEVPHELHKTVIAFIIMVSMII